MEKLGIIKTLFEYLIKRKKFWLIPLVAIILLLAVIIIVGQVTGLGPLIYPFA
ncbi:hypothetical protein HYT84_04710 [Candidatus Micrarchaeota archaeon]|nr:hypothetical protein [Candidatus Micrarchaeota archaeon]